VAVLICSWTVAAPPVPDGQMRVVPHVHYNGDDGFRSMRTAVQYFKDLGAEAVIMTPHAHVLPESETYLDKYTRWLGVYRIKFKKGALTAVDYLRDVDDACDILPVVPGFEIGTDPSHFLAVPCWVEGLDRFCEDIIKIGQQINTIGYPTAIRAIDRIMQETGGFMIQAHPFNPSYPFVYDFSECQSAVGVEFMNERWSDHDNTRDRLLEVQKTTTRPVIATSGVDFHLDESDAGTIEGFLANTKEYPGTAGKAKAIAQTFLNATAYENRLSYVPNKRWVYVYGRTQNPMLIATLIRDGRCYAAYDEARIVAITAMPGMKYKPAVGSEFVISTRGIPAESQALDFCFVDDVTKEITKRFIRWHDDPDGTRTASVKMSDLRRDPSHLGKLIISSPWFTTSAICIEASASPQVAEQPKGPTSISIPPAVVIQISRAKPIQPPQVPATKPTAGQQVAVGSINPSQWANRYRFVSDDLDKYEWLLVYNNNLEGIVELTVHPGAPPIRLPVKFVESDRMPTFFYCYVKFSCDFRSEWDWVRATVSNLFAGSKSMKTPMRYFTIKKEREPISPGEGYICLSYFDVPNRQADLWIHAKAEGLVREVEGAMFSFEKDLNYQVLRMQARLTEF